MDFDNILLPVLKHYVALIISVLLGTNSVHATVETHFAGTTDTVSLAQRAPAF